MGLKNGIARILPLWGPPLALAGVLIALLLIVGVWYGNRRQHVGDVPASSLAVPDALLTKDLDAYVRQVAEQNGLDPSEIPEVADMLKRMPARGGPTPTGEAELKELLAAHIAQIARDRSQAPPSSRSTEAAPAAPGAGPAGGQGALPR